MSKPKSSDEMIRSMEAFVRSMGKRDPIEPVCGLWTSVFEHILEFRVVTERIEMTRDLFERVIAGVPIKHNGDKTIVKFRSGIEITIRESTPLLPDDWIMLWGYLIKYDSDITA